MPMRTLDNRHLAPISVKGHTISRGEVFTLHGRQLPEGDYINLIAIGDRYYPFAYRERADALHVAAKLEREGARNDTVEHPSQTTLVSSI